MRFKYITAKVPLAIADEDIVYLLKNNVAPSCEIVGSDVRAKFFWDCECTWWQEKFSPQMERCGMCAQTAKFFEMPKEQQAIEIKRLYEAQAAMSSWLAVQLGESDTVQIPRNVASASAGWTR